MNDYAPELLTSIFNCPFSTDFNKQTKKSKHETSQLIVFGYINWNIVSKESKNVQKVPNSTHMFCNPRVGWF